VYSIANVSCRLLSEITPTLQLIGHVLAENHDQWRARKLKTVQFIEFWTENQLYSSIAVTGYY
jgi:hypothetical protein